MKKLIIHIGTEKTGTTSIQQHLNRNRSALNEKYSILYPDFGYSSLAQFELVAALHPMCNSGRVAEFAPANHYEPDRIWNDFCDLVRRCNNDIVVISSEHFSSRLNEVGIKFIKNKLDKELPDYNVEILIYLRNQVDMFQSAYSTYIKTGGTKSFSELFNGMDGSGIYYNYYNLVNLWSDQFGEKSLTIRNFNTLSKSGGVVVDFFDYLNVNEFESDITLDENRTWNPVFLEFARNLNLGALSKEDHGRRYLKYESIVKTNSYFSVFNEFSVLPNHIAFEMEQLFFESNVKLNNLIGGSTGSSYFEPWKPRKKEYNYCDFTTHLSEVLLNSLG